jgi:hypothetical protein
MRRRVVGIVALFGALAALAFVLRTNTRRKERVELFYEDGSLMTLVDDDAKPLLDVARSALDAAHA